MGGNRITTRFSTNFSYPDIAYKIKKRVTKYLIDIFKFNDFKEPKFHHGMVASYASHNDVCIEHLDPQYHDFYETLHCNLMLQKPLKGGEPIIEDEYVNLNERDLWCYYVSKVRHGAAKVTGNIPRLMFVFGFCVKYKAL